MNILFSKTDALGDQLIASGLVHELLMHYQPRLFVWCVRAGYESVSYLLEGSRVFTPDMTRPALEEARRLLAFGVDPVTYASPWSRVVFVSLPFDAYVPWPASRNREKDCDWLFEWSESLKAELAIAGTVNLNWVDESIVCASQAPDRLGIEHHSYCESMDDFTVRCLRQRGAGGVSFTHQIPFDPKRHELDTFSDFLFELTGLKQSLAVNLSIPPAAVSEIVPRLVVAPGAGNIQKIYPPDKMAKVVSQLDLTTGAPILLCGPADRDVCVTVAEELSRRGVDSETRSVDGSSMDRVVALLRQASILLCNDSFVVHLAAYLGTPTVVIWGGGHDERFSPRQGRVSMIRCPMLCYNCQWNCFMPSVRCVADILPEMVVKEVNRRVHSPKERKTEFVSCPAQWDPQQVFEKYREKSESLFLAHHKQFHELTQLYAASESDRAARLKVIEDQGVQLGKVDSERNDLRCQLVDKLKQCKDLELEYEHLRHRLSDAESDRAARLRVIDEQGKNLGRVESELNNIRLFLADKTAQLADKTAQLDASESDRAARLRVIEEQGKNLGRVESELNNIRLFLADKTAQLVDKTAQLDASESDRAARLAVIEEQGRRLGAAESVCNELSCQLREKIGQLDASEADREARLKVIETQGQQLGRIPQREVEKDRLIAQLHESEADRAALYANRFVKMGLKVGLIPRKRA